MVLKVLQASTFHSFVSKGGTTRPWIVLLHDETGVDVAYVVKLFNEKDAYEQHPVLKEVLGSILAGQFGLRTPGFALADFTPQFIAHVLNKEQKDILVVKDQGLKFASVLLESASIFSPALHRSSLMNYDFANLYAFDCLIFNLDRGRNIEKPNVFVFDDEFVVFDHELSWPFIDNEPGYFNMIIRGLEKDEIEFPFRKHFCHPFLKDLRAKDKKHLFDEFEDSLSRVNIRAVSNTIDILRDLKVSCGNADRILTYLYALKQNASLFTKLLLKSIS